MEKLTEKKRKWIINQFRTGRSATSIARIQKISRQSVYKLVKKYKKEGVEAYKVRKAGKPRYNINPNFVKQVTEIRNSEDYGSGKIHFVLKQQGYSVSQHIIQRILDEKELTDHCLKRQGQRKYVRYEWPVCNFMWHTDWSFLNGKWYIAYLDDKSRRIMAAGVFDNATEANSLFILYQAMLANGVCPILILSDKGTQFYNSKKNNKGERPPSKFEKELAKLGILFWTSRRNHPQTNGKMEKWFDTMKKRKKKHPEETLQEFVYWYNEKRIHDALKYSTPNRIYFKNL